MSVIGKRLYGYFAKTEQKCKAKLVCPSPMCLVLTSFETAEFKVRKWTHLRVRMAWRPRSYFHFQWWNKIMHHNLMGNCQHPWLKRAPTVCVEREKKKTILGGTKVLHGNIMYHHFPEDHTHYDHIFINSNYSRKSGRRRYWFHFFLLIKSARYVENENLCSRAVFWGGTGAKLIPLLG